MADPLLNVPAGWPEAQVHCAFDTPLKPTTDAIDVPGTTHELRRLGRVDLHAVLQQLTRLEKKAFPSYEVFPFNVNLVKQPNATVMFLTDDALDSPTHPRPIQAYAVCVSSRGRMLLHKICVAESWRRKGFGKYLVHQIIARAQNMSCRFVELWVCASRTAARQLYFRCGFAEAQCVRDYYRAGRHAIKMVLSLES